MWILGSSVLLSTSIQYPLLVTCLTKWVWMKVYLGTGSRFWYSISITCSARSYGKQDNAIVASRNKISHSQKNNLVYFATKPVFLDTPCVHFSPWTFCTIVFCICKTREFVFRFQCSPLPLLFTWAFWRTENGFLVTVLLFFFCNSCSY